MSIERTKVAHIVPHLEMGGIQTLVVELMRSLDRTRFDPMIVSLGGPNHFEEEIRDRGWAAATVRVSSKCRVKELRRLADFLTEQGVSIAHLHGYHPVLSGRLSAVAAGVPRIVTHFHNPYGWNGDQVGSEFRRAESYLANETDLYIGCGQHIEAYLRETLAVGSRVRLLVNGINLEPFRSEVPHREENRSRFGIQPDVFHIVHTGRLEARKNPGDLIRTLTASVPERCNRLGKWQLTFVGGGSLEESLKEEVRRIDQEHVAKGLPSVAERIHFSGWTKEVAAWLSTADVFCLLSSMEGLPLSIVEAMSSNVPVVGYNIGPVREVLAEGEYGLLVEHGNVDGVLDALVRLREEPGLHQRLVAKGQERAERYSLARYVAELQDIYADLMRDHHGSRHGKSGLSSALYLWRGSRIVYKARKKSD
jgi:glycosyltransferase involved in cell wall biosynthesis